MANKLSDAIPRSYATYTEALATVFSNADDVSDFFAGCRDYPTFTSFLNRLDREYELLKVLNENSSKPLDFFSIISNQGGLVVTCLLRPKYVLQKPLPATDELSLNTLKKFYPNAKEEALLAFNDFIFYNTDLEGYAERVPELIKEWNRQLNDGDDYIVLRMKDEDNPCITHKLCINKKDLY
jgi:hypothetical protein